MKQFQYSLQPYKGVRSRFQCPNCNTKESFVRYIDLTTDSVLDPSVGRCNREDKCGYHLKPKDFFDKNGVRIDRPVQEPHKVTHQPPSRPLFIESIVVQRSMQGYDRNNLVLYLIKVLGENRALDVAAKYRIGTSKKWPGGTIFFQIDQKGLARRGKVMLYDPSTGRRDHNKNHSVHALLGRSHEKPAECFFGEHLLNGNNKTVCVVESEKTAVIASIYLPHCIWLACGGLSMLNYNKVKALRKRNVILYPDLGGYKLWTEKGEIFLPKIAQSWKVSTVLEKNGTQEERKNGLDLADYLLRYKPEEFNF